MLKPAEKCAKGTTLLTGGSPAHPERIVRGGESWSRSGRPPRTRIFHLEFSQVRTAEGLVAFMNRYGALTNEKLGYENVRNILECAQEMRDLIVAERSRMRIVAQGGRLDISGLTASLVIDGLTGELRYQLRAPNLLEALRMQFSRDLINDTLGACRKCGVPFHRESGPADGGDAMFCTRCTS